MIVSDRNMKRDFAPVNDGEILKAVEALPISSWSYKGDGTNARHIGPMAQDFMSTFHVGSNDRTILQVDGDGISLAAIKALSQRLKDLEARNESLEAQVSDLRARLSRSCRGEENRRPSGTR
jgi:Chaperone of endosialidase